MPQTDLRVVKTLKQIDQALLESLYEMPFEKITVDQLCQTAIINRSTFYKYYKSKYDLMEQYLKRTLNEFQKTDECGVYQCFSGKYPSSDISEKL